MHRISVHIFKLVVFGMVTQNQNRKEITEEVSNGNLFYTLYAVSQCVNYKKSNDYKWNRSDHKCVVQRHTETNTPQLCR